MPTDTDTKSKKRNGTAVVPETPAMRALAAVVTAYTAKNDKLAAHLADTSETSRAALARLMAQTDRQREANNKLEGKRQ